LMVRVRSKMRGAEQAQSTGHPQQTGSLSG
jgi:hypothetical protein